MVTIDLVYRLLSRDHCPLRSNWARDTPKEWCLGMNSLFEHAISNFGDDDSLGVYRVFVSSGTSGKEFVHLENVYDS